MCLSQRARGDAEVWVRVYTCQALSADILTIKVQGKDWLHTRLWREVGFPPTPGGSGNWFLEGSSAIHAKEQQVHV